MIAYHILCHTNFAQVRQLIESIYSDDDVFLIDVDDGGSPDLAPIKDLCARDNIHLVEDSDIGWGGPGTLRKTINGAFKLLSLDADWEYYVVLSGQDLPLKSNGRIKQFLKKGAQKKTNFIRTNKAAVERLCDIPVHNTTGNLVLWGDRGHTKVFACPGTINPQTTSYSRALVDVAEVGVKGEVYVKNADELLLRHRANFFAHYPYYVGANWFNLHRSLIEFMVDDPFAYELYEILRSTYIPDESYFQTYIRNTSFKETVDHEIGRFILRPGPIPKVKVFDMADWHELEKTPSLFGRKFDTNHDKAIVSRVLESRAA